MWTVSYFRHRALSSPAALLQRLPAADAVVLYVDFGALRQAGILDLMAGSRMADEPEYRVFMDSTGFDYRTDLDSALISFHPKATFFFVRGRFDWKRLQAHAIGQGGSCRNSLCQLPGSTPDRNISFFPAQRDLMALAVAPGKSAATAMQASNGALRLSEAPNQPVWLSAPASVLREPSRLPPGIRALAATLAEMDGVTLSAGMNQQGVEIQLAGRCTLPQQAEALAKKLERATSLMRGLAATEAAQSDPNNLVSVLGGGVFRSEGSQVVGRWTVERRLLETLAGDL